ncbi:MAG TPA: hypothetical protein VMW69_05170 [Spirochaetia bacterium]|nr:hypothetical protein [Spirochaetia bacterium]
MKILIVHFRSAPRADSTADGSATTNESAGTDGVSLEIAKRTAILEEMGNEVAVCSAYPWADIAVPELEFENELPVQMMKDLFRPHEREGLEDGVLERRFESQKNALLVRFRKLFGDFSPDLAFVHNVLCLPIHAAATVALTEWIKETKLPCAGIHHDILNEGAYQFVPTCPLAEDLLASAFPPRLSNLRHWTINKRNRRALSERGFEAGLIHDTMDFSQSLSRFERIGLRETLRARWGIKEEEIVLLLSTRIVANKQAEIAGDLCKAVEELKSQFIGRRLSGGRLVSKETGVHLVLAGRPERAFLGYRDAVFAHFGDLGIRWSYVGDEVFPRRDPTGRGYSLYPDTYAIADFGLYPSRWEGFGNQFLEIVASRLPAAVFEYPVFIEDIAPFGFRIVSLGRETESPEGAGVLRRLPSNRLEEAARGIWETLTHPDDAAQSCERNLELANANFGLPVLQEHLREILEWARSIDGAGTSNTL